MPLCSAKFLFNQGIANQLSGIHLKASITTGLFILLLTYSFGQIPVAQDPDYKTIFGSNWLKAQAYVDENRNWMKQLLEENHIPSDVGIAIIFPELVRYSAIRDKMEVSVLKALYINLGDDYADFSIGQFQMKPSFAMSVRKNLSQASLRRLGLRTRFKQDSTDIKMFRRSIVNDLEEPEKEFRYLIGFIRICEKKYEISKLDAEEKLRFLAAAYNYGIDKSYSQIEGIMDRKFFHTGLIRSDIYCYSDVSLFWYRNNISKIK